MDCKQCEFYEKQIEEYKKLLKETAEKRDTFIEEMYKVLGKRTK